MWKQIGKAQWLREGDRNTPLFHARASARRRKNSITRLRDGDGERCNSKEGIQHIISTYFQDIFWSTNPSEKVIAEALGGMTARVSDDMNEALIKPFSPEEVKHAIFQMYPYKSPDPDGLSPGRLITDNVLVDFEVNHYLEHKTHGSFGQAALKLDLSKAYDRVKWIFLERVMFHLGFHPHFISLILMCVSTVFYSLMLDGHKFDRSHPKRGIRQGDPLSLYLFLFCAEVLSHLLVMAESQGELRGVAISRQGPRVSHLLFAADTLIFCQATEEAMTCVGWVLKDFEAASEMVVNLDKSEISFSSNTPGHFQEELARILGVRVVEKHVKYLGLPALVGQSKKEIFQSLKDRIWKRLQSWRCKNLSQGSKAMLLLYVVQAMPTYIMGCFLIPISICREIEGLMADFLWHNKEVRRVH
ncbi:UNVERIFIED_CONTAM: hypothetical protein Slati_2359600 [Sesamum latifolium]|uniref:Reverse transcriptase domain-containing protein n=1 Tax=Sesamum latifolium TaxID=2727402 RepID=A0AAW2WDG1_9LAMI